MNFKTILVALCVSIFAFGQSDEAKQAQKDLDAKNYKGAVMTTQKILNNDITHVNPQDLRELYYINGMANQENGNLLDAAKSFMGLINLEQSPIYFVKNKSTKEKKYFTAQAEAEKYANQVDGSVKEMQLDTKYSPLVQANLATLYQTSSQKGNEAYEKKDYKTAARNFLQSYYLSKALGGENSETFVYYAAISEYQGEDYAASKPLFQKIVELGFEGNDPDTNFLEDSYRLLAFIDGKNEDWQEVIKTAKAGLEKFPNNQDLSSALSNAYYKTGNDKAFTEQLKDNISKNPNDPINFYNLGVIYNRNDEFDLAKDNFLKAIELDPNYKDAYNNLAILYVKKDSALKKQIGNLSTSDLDSDQFDAIEMQRKVMFQELTPLMEKAHILQPDNKLYVQVLALGYNVLGDNENETKYRTLLKSM